MSSNQYLNAADKKVELGELQIYSAKLQVQTQIMHKNLAVILQQLCYCNSIGFI